MWATNRNRNEENQNRFISPYCYRYHSRHCHRHLFPAPLVRIFVTFNGIFSEFLNFSIPLIILGLVTVAIADIGKGAGKMLLITALIAYGATLFSGFLSYFTGVTIFPSLIEPGVPLEEVSEAQGILPYFSVSIPR